jgi:hypothetical protein
MDWTDKAPPDAATLMHADGTETPAEQDDGWGWTCRWDSDVIDRNRRVLIPLGFATMLSVMMAHVSGFVRETVDPKKLNKARAANGKHAIPTHTVLRIGHVYNSAGQKVKVTVSSILQTSAGRIIFAKLQKGPLADAPAAGPAEQAAHPDL